MGIYDRDYERGYGGGGWRPEGQSGFQLRMPESTIGRIIVVTIVVYLVELVAVQPMMQWFALRSDWPGEPWRFYTLLTYGLLHSPGDLMHILFNMYGLWLFGSDLERRSGPKELLLFYVLAILAGGIAYTIGGAITGTASYAIGASAGTVAVTILFAILYPHKTILLMFVLPVPMWFLGVLLVGGDIMGAISRTSQIACSAHLGGAAFALAYYLSGVRLSSFLPDDFSLPKVNRGPKLRVHREEDEVYDSKPDKMQEEVDRILKKISDQGQDSLTRGEKRTLEKASRQYKNR